MAISQIQHNVQVSQRAYSRANLFDEMKRGKKAGPDGSAQQADTASETELLSVSVPEKPKPNTVPFKPGFQFEYETTTDNAQIAVTISDSRNVKVEAKNGADLGDRRKMIRALVLMGLGGLSYTEVNERYGAPGGNGMELIRREVSGMGLNTDIPFGLGERSFYFTAANVINEYKPLNIQA